MNRDDILNQVAPTFTRLQRAVTAMEFNFLMSKGEKVREARLIIERVVKQAEDLYLLLVEDNEMTKKKGGIGNTKKKIPNGTKQPKTNQGVKPSPKSGNC